MKGGGLCINWEILLMEKDRSGLVMVKVRYCKAPMMLQYRVAPTVGVPSFKMKVAIGDKGVGDGFASAISDLWRTSHMNLCYQKGIGPRCWV